jgi:membrane protease YdiL (CAAX protease family)
LTPGPTTPSPPRWPWVAKTAAQPEGAPGWNLAEVALSFLIGYGLAGLSSSLVAASVGWQSGKDRPEPLGVIAASLIGLWVGLLGGAVVLGRRRGTGDLVADLGLRFRDWRDVVGGALAGLICQYGVIWALYEPFVANNPGLRHRLDAPATSETGGSHGAFEITVLVFLLCVGAPLVEEVFFRGLLLRALSARLRGLGRAGPVVSVVVTGAVFGLAHFELLQFAGLAVFGSILALITLRVGRLGPAIAAHAAFNAAAVITALSGHG